MLTVGADFTTHAARKMQVDRVARGKSRMMPVFIARVRE